MAAHARRLAYPGTPAKQLLIMGMYMAYDEKTDTQTITIYTADKNGYQSRFKVKRRGLSAKLLMSLAKGSK